MYSNEIKEKAFAIKDHIVELRRDLHRHPEPSQKELRTHEQIVKELLDIGITEMKTYYNTGLAAVIRGAYPGKTIGIRADMDALYIQEDTGLEFASENPGVAHSCGHDGHVSMLLGAARILYGMKDRLHGNVKLIFQPAEEDGLNGGGSQWMIKEGILTDEPKVDFVIGQHINPDLPVGTIGCKPGPFFTTSDLFVIEIIGKGGHSSTPQKALDPIVCGAQIIMGLQTVVSRSIDPLDSVVLSVCTVNSGTRHNVIPDTLTMSGGARSYTDENSAMCRKRIREVVEGTCAAMGLTSKITFKKSYGPVINDPEMFAKCEAWATEVLGEGNFRTIPPMTGGEDFSNFAVDIPGVYSVVGARCTDREQTGLHTPKFTFNEDALPYGIMNLCATAVNYLQD